MVDESGEVSRNKAAWDKARKEYWKAKGRTDGTAPKRRVLVEFKDGSRDRIWESKELHHRKPVHSGGGHSPKNLRELWPEKHSVVDSFRHVNYKVIKVLVDEFGNRL